MKGELNMQNYGSIIYLIGLVILVYFLIIRPQQQRTKQQRKTMDSLAPNVNVTTYSGILGTIVKVKDNTVIIKVADNVKIEMLKSAIAFINESGEENKE